MSSSLPRTTVYIDGFNLYYGVLKGRPDLKWLDLRSLFTPPPERPAEVTVKYFTSILHNNPPTEQITDQLSRQRAYIAAVKSTGVAVIYGRFQQRRALCYHCHQEYFTLEEKKTGVALAVAMLTDVFSGATDRIVLVSGDTDLHPAIQWLRQSRRDIRVSVLVPTRHDLNPIDFYAQLGVSVTPLTQAHVAQHQFPDELPVGGRILRRPAAWPTTPPIRPRPGPRP